MQIVKLPIGIIAPPETDCVRIQQAADGAFLLYGTILPVRDDDEADSVSMAASTPYDTYESAESAGIAWAAECGVEVLHVSRSDGAVPLPESP